MQIFNNVLDTQVLESVRSSKGQRTLLMQRLTWEFLVFRGSFFAHLWVDENDADGTLDFVLKESSFMSTFRGCWTVVRPRLPQLSVHGSSGCMTRTIDPSYDRDRVCPAVSHLRTARHLFIDPHTMPHGVSSTALC